MPDPTSVPLIPSQVSIPVQLQNGGRMGMGPLDLSQQMSEMDLNMQQQRSSPLPSAAVGVPLRQGLMEFSPQMNRSRGAFSGGQNFTGGPILYSDNYPQGALYLGSYSNPMLTSWQYPPPQTTPNKAPPQSESEKY